MRSSTIASRRFARGAAAIALLLASQIAMMPDASAASVIDQQQTQIDPGGAFIGAAANQTIAQTFVAGVTGTLDRVSLHMRLQNSPAPGDLVVQIRSVDGSGSPTDEILGGGTLPAGDFVPFDTQWRDIALPQAAQVTAGTAYALVVSSTEPSTFDTGIYYLSEVPVADAYPQGVMAYKIGSGTFQLSPSEDLVFKTWVSSAPADEPGTPALTNAGFETGTLSGWSTSGSGGSFVTTSYSGLAAPEGRYFAVVPAGCPTTRLIQQFTAKAGQTLSGWGFFRANDYMPFNDNGSIKVVLESGSNLVTTLFSSSISAVGDFGQTPWTAWTHTFAASGTYTIEVQSSNALDCIGASVVGIDMGTTDGDAPDLTVSHQTDGANGWNIASPVALAITADDASPLAGPPTCQADGADLTVSGSGSSFSAAVSGDGIHHIVCTASDTYGNTGTGSDTVSIDTVAPQITAGASAGGAGYVSATWTNHDVSVTFSCSDATSGVASLTGDTSVSTEGAGQSVTGSCSDQAGNVADTQFDGIQIDKSLPAISASATSGGLPYGAGTWTNDDVVIAYECTDAVSGVAIVSAPDTVSTEGAGQSRTGSCSDMSGNTASVTFDHIQIDKTAPVLSGAPSTDPNDDGWYSEGVTVGWTCSDTLSGIEGTCPDDTVLAAEGAGLSATQSLADRAGNVATATVSNINIDRTPPLVSVADRSPAPNGAGWNRSAVTLTFSCVDDLSGVKSCPGPKTIGADGEGQSVDATATDKAGNEHTLTVSDIHIDSTPPSLEGHPTTEPNGNGWYNDDVTIAWNASDGLSGLDPSTVPGAAVIGGEGESLTAGASVQDRAGNETTASSPPISIDRTAPITTAAAPGWSKEVVVVDLEATDNLSGVATTTYSIDGGPAQSGSEIAISEEGVHSLSFFSEDRAGNVEDATTIEVKIDKTAPTIDYALDPAPNGRGWNNRDVTVSFACSDSLSGVASCTDPVTLSTEGENQTIEGRAVDTAGNEATATASASIDKTAPGIVGSADADANGNGWYNAPVAVAFSCSDARSGIVSCPDGVTLSSEGGDQQVSGTARDAADNEADTTVSGINIDMTPPVLAGAPSTDPNANGWYGGDVTIRWTCDDGLSGIAGGCPEDSIITGEGAALAATASVTDRAGNTTTVTVDGIRIDRTAPVVAYSGNAGSYTLDQDVDLSCTAFDALSGLSSNTCEQVQGPAYSFGLGSHTFESSATDRAGNEQTASATFEVLATHDGLCTLSKRFASRHGVANSLCAKLEAAKQAAARGNQNAGLGALQAYRNEVAAQSGKGLTADHAAILTEASLAL